MRIITGSARGVRLQTPAGLDTRPTTERVKEAVFSALQFEIEGRRVLDLFAGSGQMGLEALSRGAKSAVLVDNAAAAIKVMTHNAAATRLDSQVRIVQAEALGYLQRAAEQGAVFDMIFLDPPYRAGLMPVLLEAVSHTLAAGGVAVCETAGNEQLPEAIGTLALYRRYHYGKTTAVHIYRKHALA